VKEKSERVSAFAFVLTDCYGTGVTVGTAVGVVVVAAAVAEGSTEALGVGDILERLFAFPVVASIASVL